MRSFSKPLMAGAVMTCATCAALFATAPTARATDDLPYVYIPPIDVDVNVDVDLGRRHPPRYYDPRDVYAGIPPGHYAHEIDRPLVAPDQVAAMLRSTGFSMLGPINRRGWVYTAAVLNPRGDDGRVIIDARTGAIIRFLPAFAINERTDRELSTLYGPPGSPPGFPSGPPIGQDMRRLPRPPMAAPKLANRSPVAMPSPRAQPLVKTAPLPGQAVKPSAPSTQQAASVQTKPPEAPATEAAKPVEAKPAPVKPAEVELKPTQAMPPMQTLE